MFNNSSADGANDTDSNKTTACIICSHNTPVFVAIIQTIIGIFVTVTNAVTIAALSRCRGIKKTLRMLLITQSVTDTLFGLVYIYHSIVVYIIWHDIRECIFRYSLLSLSSAVSLNTVAMLSLERIAAIKFPYKYHDISSKLFMTVTGVIIWAAPVAVIITGFSFAENTIPECNFLMLATPITLLIFSVISLSIMLVIIACSVIVFQEARKHIRKIIPTFIGKSKYKQNVKMHLKATLTSASVVIPFLVLNAPQYVYFIVLAVRSSLRFELWGLHIMNVVSTMVMLNSVLNPIIYTWRLEELRRQLMRFLCPEKFHRANTVQIFTT